MHLRRAVPSPPLLKDAPSFGRPVVPTSSPSPSSCPLCRPTRAARLHRPPPLGLLRCLLPPLCPRATVSPPVASVTSPQWTCAAQSPSQAIRASHAPDRTRCHRHLHPEARSSPSDVIAYLLLVPETRKASLRGRAVRPLGVATAVSRWTVAMAPCLSLSGPCNQSAPSWATETTHFSPSRGPGGPSSRCRPARSTPHLLLPAPVSHLFSVPWPERSL